MSVSVLSILHIDNYHCDLGVNHVFLSTRLPLAEIQHSRGVRSIQHISYRMPFKLYIEGNKLKHVFSRAPWGQYHWVPIDSLRVNTWKLYLSGTRTQKPFIYIKFTSGWELISFLLETSFAQATSNLVLILNWKSIDLFFWTCRNPILILREPLI